MNTRRKKKISEKRDGPPFRLDILTLFPRMFDAPFSESLMGKAQKAGVVNFRVHDLRHWAEGRHKTCDDRPYGGGAGMLLKPEPIWRALRALGAFGRQKKGRPYVIYLSPQGKTLHQGLVRQLVRHRWLILLCGHYEGVDERVLSWVDQEVSIGNYVLTGGEIPAMVVADAVMRLVPGVVKEAASLEAESFSSGVLDFPQYTRPQKFRDLEVPKVLLSGNHADIAAWRRRRAMIETKKKRPDLLEASRRSK